LAGAFAPAQRDALGRRAAGGIDRPNFSLPVDDWQKLKAAIDSKGGEFTDRMLGAINSMLVEMMAAITQKDYESRRELQALGIEKAKAAGKYQSRQVDADLHKQVRELLAAHRPARKLLDQHGDADQGDGVTAASRST